MKFTRLPNGQVFNIARVLTTTIQAVEEGEEENKKTIFIGALVLQNQKLFSLINSENLDEVKKFMEQVDELLMVLG